MRTFAWIRSANFWQINLIYYYLQEVNEKKIIYHRKYLHDLEESRRLRERLGVTSARMTFEEGEPEDEVDSSNFRFRDGVPPEAEADSPDLPSSSNAWISSAANWFTSFHMGTTIWPPRKEAKTLGAVRSNFLNSRGTWTYETSRLLRRRFSASSMSVSSLPTERASAFTDAHRDSVITTSGWDGVFFLRKMTRGIQLSRRPVCSADDYYAMI